MPESCKDRPARCYEYVFLLTKSKKYYYDWQAVAEPIAPATAGRLKSGVGKGNKYSVTVPGQNQPQKINRPREKGAYADEMISPVRSLSLIHISREDDEEYQSPVDLLFADLEERSPDHFAVKQYKKYKLAAGKTAKSILISCGARLAPRCV